MRNKKLLLQPRSKEEIYGPALTKAKRDIAALDPWEAAFKAAVDYRETGEGQGEWSVLFWNKRYKVTYPDGKVTEEDTGAVPPFSTLLIILHYLINADGTPLAEHWVSFREFPGGQGYWPVFQGRTALKLAKTFGRDKEAFEKAARVLGGEKLSFGDSSFLFRMFPRLWMAVVLNLADEEFGPSVQVLFDGSAGHYLPTEDLVILGEMLTHRLIREAQKG
ncbi:MAG: hypothetical protein DRI61_03980 [Chloroflexi bacterium]|nr:MAG: hypothetical protein DRI61_03980 [Chloroflexota bacterium]HDN79242.1 DUF3786 domain-containing protein [Chloroflexota bacterium]